ncbi:MAG: hypothetical protein CMF95_00700 [Candidatus Marinimicrobia bacterium]|nr:hypothetical protein [Candidatus Neomarinimicrobiota bacterium]
MHLTFKIYFLLSLSLYGIGTQFLVTPYNANELSVGSHPTYLALVNLNPALYSQEKKNSSLMVNRGSWVGDVSLSSLGYIQKVNDKTFYFGARYSALSDLEFRGEKPEDEPLGYFTSHGLSFKSGISLNRNNKAYGFSISYVSMGIYTESSSGIGLGFGYLAKLKKGVNLGISIQNIGKMSVLDNEAPQLPLRVLIGSSKLFNLLMFSSTVYTSAELNSLNSKINYKYNLGNKLTWKQIDILSGFSISERVNYVSLGLNLKLKKYEISYGININSQSLGEPQILSLKFQLP